MTETLNISISSDMDSVEYNESHYDILDQSQLHIVLIEPFHPAIHGQTDNSSPNIDRYSLVHSAYSVDDFYCGEHEFAIRMLNRSYNNLLPKLLETDMTIRNYRKLVAPNNGSADFQIILARVIELPEGKEYIAIDRTGGLRRFQRHFRKWRMSC